MLDSINNDISTNDEQQEQEQQPLLPSSPPVQQQQLSSSSRRSSYHHHHHRTTTTTRSQQQQQQSDHTSNNNTIIDTNNPFRYNPTMQQQQQQQYDIATSAATSSNMEWFRHTPITKYILIFTMVCYIVLLQNNNNSSNSNNNSNQQRGIIGIWDVWNIPPLLISTSSSTATSTTTTAIILIQPMKNVIWYQYITSKIFFLLPTTTMTTSSITNYQYNIIITGIVAQYHLYKHIERQMSSKQFVYYIIFIYLCTIAMEIVFYHPMIKQLLTFLVSILNNTNNSNQQQQQQLLLIPKQFVVYISSMGPYHMIGAISYYYHIYTPAVYPRFVSIPNPLRYYFYRFRNSNGIHFSEKSLFYFYILYFIMISNNNSITNMNTHSLHHDITANFSSWRWYYVLKIYTTYYNGTINAIIYMSMGMISTMLYHYISSHPIVVQYERTILQPIIQRYIHASNNNNNNNNNNSTRSSTGSRRNPQQQQQQAIRIPPLPQQQTRQPTSSSLMRQRHSAAATATAAAAANAWRIHEEGQEHFHNDPDTIDNTGIIGTATTTTTTTNNTINTIGDVPILQVSEIDDNAIEQLCAMGFERSQVIMALRQTHNNIEHAANRLLSGME